MTPQLRVTVSNAFSVIRDAIERVKESSRFNCDQTKPTSLPIFSSARRGATMAQATPSRENNTSRSIRRRRASELAKCAFAESARKSYGRSKSKLQIYFPSEPLNIRILSKIDVCLVYMETEEKTGEKHPILRFRAAKSALPSIVPS